VAELPGRSQIDPAGRRRQRRARARGLALGAALVAAGVALLLLVAWQQWGTGIVTARAQSRLKAEFHRTLTHPAGAGPTETPAIPGHADGLIRIPKLGVDAAFVEGVALDDLALGPGHYPGTPMPGHRGNVAIAGHRTTHGAPFWALDSLRRGDDITVITRRGTFVYRVLWVRVMPADASWVLRRTALPSLTLTTCWPRFSNTHRLVVRALQVSGRGLRARVPNRDVSGPSRSALVRG